MKRDRSSLGISFKAAKPRQIHEIARAAGIRLEELRPYGSYKAKVSVSLLERLKAKPSGRLICVSSMTPTGGGEGKTCTAIGLTQAMALLKKKVALCLREPSLGPLFGGSPVGTGAGYAQILPADEINLHFTGDAHATNAATNLLAAVIDNHRHRGNALDIDAGRVYWKRALDITESTPAFDLTAASEIMAILSMAKSIADLKLRLSRILIGVTKKGEPVTAKDLKAVGAMAVLVKDAIEPNLVQTMESQPCLVHTGPSSLFSHGNNSILATEMALKLADYVVTESGYGTDMGLEKLFNIVSHSTTFRPAAVVIVVTAKALRNQSKDGSLKEGFENLEKHVQNVKAFGLEPVIAINRFPRDGEAEILFIVDYLRMRHIEAAVCNAVGQGGAGTIALAEAVMKVLKKEPEFKPLYGLELDPLEKCRIIARTIYGADDVVLTGTAKEDLELARRLGYAELPVSIAKTPFSLADDDSVKGVPRGWKLNIHSFRIWAGAGYLVAHAGKPSPASAAPFETLLEQIDLDENGQISGNTLEG